MPNIWPRLKRPIIILAIVLTVAAILRLVYGGQ